MLGRKVEPADRRLALLAFAMLAVIIPIYEHRHIQ